MCKEDIRLARAAKPKSSANGVSQSPGTKFLNGDPERYSLSAAINSAVDQTAGQTIIVYAKFGGVIYPLIGLSRDHPAGTVCLTDVGQIIEYEIWVEAHDTTSQAAVVVSDCCFMQGQGDI